MRNLIFPVVFTLVLFAFACQRQEASRSPQEASRSPREVATPPPASAPQRIITLSPGLTEITFAVGAGELVVGVSQFTVYPPEALDKAKCGGYFDPNKEMILSLQPDLILVQGKHEKVREFCRVNDLLIEEFKLDTIADIQAALRQAGKLFGYEERAEEICANIIAELEALSSELPREQWPRVFICPARQEGSMANIMTAGKGSFLGEMLEAAGGVNIYGDSEQLYPQVSKESLLARAPDVILELRPGEKINERKAAKLRAEWAPLALLPAVQEGRIRIITYDAIQIPGPRIAESVRRLREAVYRDWKGKQP